MENIKTFVEYLVGDRWPLLLVGFVFMLIFAYKNCYNTKGTGQVYYNQGDGFFVFLSSVAGCFHFADLMCEWIEGELVLIRPAVSENYQIYSILLAASFGVAIGWFFYASAQLVMARRTEFIERRYFLRHMHSLRWQQDDYFDRYDRFNKF